MKTELEIKYEMLKIKEELKKAEFDNDIALLQGQYSALDWVLRADSHLN